MRSAVVGTRRSAVDPVIRQARKRLLLRRKRRSIYPPPSDHMLNPLVEDCAQSCIRMQIATLQPAGCGTSACRFTVAGLKSTIRVDHLEYQLLNQCDRDNLVLILYSRITNGFSSCIGINDW